MLLRRTAPAYEMMTSNEKLNSEVPKTYVFKKRKDLRRYYEDTDITRRFEPKEDEIIPQVKLSLHPRRSLLANHRSIPRTYQFRRIQFSNDDQEIKHDISTMTLNLSNLNNKDKKTDGDEDQEQRMSRRDDDLPVPLRFENVPMTYRFKSSYRREKPPGTYQKQKEPEKQIMKEKVKNVPSDSIGMIHSKNIPSDCIGTTNRDNRSGLQEICGCWFSLYNGYCNGHENESKSYFNISKHNSKEHLRVWTEYPNNGNKNRSENDQFPYRDGNFSSYGDSEYRNSNSDKRTNNERNEREIITENSYSSFNHSSIFIHPNLSSSTFSRISSPFPFSSEFNERSQYNVNSNNSSNKNFYDQNHDMEDENCIYSDDDDL